MNALVLARQVHYACVMTNSRTSSTESPPIAKARPWIAWRLLALLYDALPALALWMVVGTLFTVGYTLAGHPLRENIKPFSTLQWLEWLCCWVATGTYAILSWRRGGQTLGMRPWRLRVSGIDGAPASLSALCRRYAMGSISLLFGGLGFWWAWIDRDHLTWHDRFSATRIQRSEKKQ